VLENANPGAGLKGLSFNRHNAAHIARAAQEGIVFSLHYGMEIMQAMGMPLNTIKAGFANMFLSDIFANAFSSLTGCVIELYNTDGSIGSARGAGLGSGLYANNAEAFKGMQIVKSFYPDNASQSIYQDAYNHWKNNMY
jgi:xylulokinase